MAQVTGKSLQLNTGTKTAVPSASLKPAPKPVAAPTQISPINGNYPANFNGPVKPGQTIGGVNPLTAQKQSNTGGGGGSSSYLSTANFSNVGGDPGTDEPNYDDQINALYNPAMSALDTAQTNLQTGLGEDTNNINNLYNSNIQGLGAEDQQTQDYYNVQQNKANTTLQGALADAIRSYKALQQQGLSRFGLGSSAGQAVGELAQQEFLRNQGAINQEQGNVGQEFALEFSKLKDYVNKKTTDFNTWKDQAVTTLNQNFRNNLAAIDGQRGQIASAKAAAKLQLLQDTVARAQQVEDTDKAYRQQLAVAAYNNVSGIAGQHFTPAQIQAQVQNIMSSFSGGTNQTAQNYTSALSQLPGSSQKTDEFGNPVA